MKKATNRSFYYVCEAVLLKKNTVSSTLEVIIGERACDLCPREATRLCFSDLVRLCRRLVLWRRAGRRSPSAVNSVVLSSSSSSSSLDYCCCCYYYYYYCSRGCEYFRRSSSRHLEEERMRAAWPRPRSISLSFAAASSRVSSFVVAAAHSTAPASSTFLFPLLLLLLLSSAPDLSTRCPAAARAALSDPSSRYYHYYPPVLTSPRTLSHLSLSYSNSPRNSSPIVPS